VAVRDAILSGAGPLTRDLAHRVSVGGTWRLLVPVITLVLLVLSQEARRRWWLWIVTLVGAPLVGGAWQELVRCTRPHRMALGSPSGHATTAAAFAVVVYLMSRSRLPGGWRLAISALAAAVSGIGFAIAAGGAWWDTAHRGPLRHTRLEPGHPVAHDPLMEDF
jgi:membrane-associated phospholipid phosphatase